MTSMERILADFIKGAERAGGTVQMGGPGIETKLAAARDAGTQAALARFKVAFLGPLLSAGASALAPAAARGVLGKVAPKALGALAKPVTGALFDTGVQMGAQKALQ